jgi:hypothetical protein
MTAEEYSKARQSIASQQKVADMLGIDLRTVQGREAGSVPISAEAERAIRSLVAEKHIPHIIERAVRETIAILSAGSWSGPTKVE